MFMFCSCCVWFLDNEIYKFILESQNGKFVTTCTALYTISYWWKLIEKIVYKNMSSWIMIITNLISTVFTFPEYNVHDDVSSVLLCLHGRKLIYMCLNPNLFCIKCTCTHDLNFIVITSLHQYAYVRYYCFYLKAIQTLWWNICKYK